ncbi:hypothetical protein TNIN_343281 [Trichonephila inaurata madagascariensis]|uniref:Uncharacterized protein n=1 Tax=Trichonephila inaurata madagascariensis TaxID=2747483 RepID=A0A8X6XBK7_9ARAC|nr:hypothetical protein TNIN_343281 [Trichonephila inaurata madagascariensis]
MFNLGEACHYFGFFNVWLVPVPNPVGGKVPRIEGENPVFTLGQKAQEYQKIEDSHCVPREVNFCSRKRRDNVANILLSWQLTPAKNLTSPERLQIPERSIIPPSTSPLNKVDHVNKSNPNKRNNLHILRIIRETWEHGTARGERDLSQKGR